MHALKDYERAVELAPNEVVYSIALQRMLQRLGIKGKDKKSGVYTVEQMPRTSKVTSVIDGDTPGYVVWERFKAKSNNLTVSPFPKTVDRDITSEEWIAQGMVYWHGAMSRKLGDLVGLGISIQMKEMSEKYGVLVDQWQSGRISKSQFDVQKFQLTGCPPSNGDEYSDMMNAIYHLMGDHLPIEIVPEGKATKKQLSKQVVPSPPWLMWYPQQQHMAICMIVYQEFVECRSVIGGTLVLSQSIASTASSFLKNVGQDESEVPKEGVTPEEAIAFIKRYVLLYVNGLIMCSI